MALDDWPAPASKKLWCRADASLFPPSPPFPLSSHAYPTIWCHWGPLSLPLPRRAKLDPVGWLASGGGIRDYCRVRRACSLLWFAVARRDGDIGERRRGGRVVASLASICPSREFPVGSSTTSVSVLLHSRPGYHGSREQSGKNDDWAMERKRRDSIRPQGKV